MISEVPSHHVKQTICATRPPYREGRHAKAVKVYTINNESCYILIQGVPSVGAMQELHKLCSSFGSVEQFNALDEYPNEDKYSEVYLVKYNKIQAARFAKRKLDDHSFFGGTLHVCYAPEHESVSETREKLQDRRRVIAAKIRQFVDNTERQQVLQTPNLQNSIHPADNSHSSSLDQLFLQKENPHSGISASLSVPGRLNSASVVGESVNRLSDVGYEVDVVQPTFQLPLPPTSELVSHVRKRSEQNTYEFSRVRSSHAMLPPGYDARLIPNVLNKSIHPEINRSSALNMPITGISQRNEALRLPSSTSPSHFTTVSSPNIIVKDYKPSKPTPRFVPRQALKNKPDQSKPGIFSKIKTDPLDQEIRKNAFHLGKTQGPAMEPNRKRAISTNEQLSVNKTISEIRNKISKVITQNVQKQNDLPGKTS